MACIVYHRRVADEHWWPGRTQVSKVRDHGKGPICVRCGLPIGTWQYETADEVHQARTGHHIGTGACVEACGWDYDHAPDFVAGLAIRSWRRVTDA